MCVCKSPRITVYQMCHIYKVNTLFSLHNDSTATLFYFFAIPETIPSHLTVRRPY